MNKLLEKYKNIYQYHKSLNKSAQTLVCLAGVSDGAYRYYESLEILTQHFNVVLFNNPGIDGAEEEMFFTVDNLAEKFQHILNLLNIDSYYLIGHSMGGFVAQRMALNNPHKINKIVLFGTSFGSFKSELDMKNIIDTKQTLKQAIENMKTKNKIIKMQNYSFPKKFQEENPKVIEKYLDEKLNKYKISKHILLAHFMCGGRFSSFNETQNILAPTLIIHGTEDKMVNIRGGIALAKTIPNAQFLELEGVGHNPFIEDIAIMNKVVDFLINGTQIGKILTKDYKITPEMLEKDYQFRRNSMKTISSQFFKELFMVDELEDKFSKYLEFFKKP